MAAAAAAATNTATQYAANLRQSLIQDLFEGDETQVNVEELGSNLDISDLLGSGDVITLQDVDQDLEQFQNHEVIKGILEQGRVLTEYAKDVDDKLRQTEMDSIQDYIAESDSMVTLHDQIKDCDSILAGLEGLLSKFQSDLGKTSEEIRQLQVQSQTMSTKLRNRRATEQRLGSFIEHMTVSERMVNGILEGEVNDDYLEYLFELDKKLKFVREDPEARSSQASRDLEPALEKLRIKALIKVREFVFHKVVLLRRPKTNVQVIQQSVLLGHKYFVRFLRHHGPDIYKEIRNEYVSIVSRIYASHLRTYLSALEKMQQPTATQMDLLGAPADGGIAGGPAGVKDVLSLFKKDTASGRMTTDQTFELGDRGQVLAQLEQPPIIPHVAETENRRFPYEVIFRNVHKLLVDTSSSEYFFCMDFFEDESVFRDVFSAMVQVVEADLVQVVQESWDALGLLLMIRICGELRACLGPHPIPSLEEYLDRVHLLMWPRLKLVFDSHLNSIRQGTERALFTESPSPHFVVRRYSALAASMLVLMAAYDSLDTPGMFKAQNFYDMMDRMWAAIFDLLLRMSNMFRDKRIGIIFLIANYSYMFNTLRAADTRGLSGSSAGGAPPAAPASVPEGGGGTGIGKTGAAALKECETQLNSCTNLYVEEQLSGQFPMLLEFVKKAEQQQRRLAIGEGQHIPNFAPAQASPILRDFASRWQNAIESMNQEVTRHFQADPSCGRHVLQASMTAFLQYYTRMLELLRRQGAEGVAVVKDAVNVPAIMYEIKRMTKAP